MKHSAVVCLALLVALAVPGPGQTGSRPRVVGDAPAPIRLGVDLVVVDAQVTQEKTRRLVGGLTKDDFVLEEDGRRQEIAHFSQDSPPLSVLLLVDRAGCLDPFGGEVQAATRRALEQLKPEDEAAVMAFHDTTELVRPFTRDRDAVLAGLYAMPGHHEEGEHCFNVALFDAARSMYGAANPNGRRVIVVLTGLTRGFDCPGPTSKEALAEVVESGSVVCGLIPKTAGQRVENGATAGVAGIAGAFGAPTFSLRRFADETGGDIFEAKPAELAQAFDDLVRHLRTRYSIGFVSTNTKKDGAYRALTLDVTPGARKREGKLLVRARRGYYAARAAAAP